MERVYMDNAATSFPKPECVYDAMDHFNRYMGGNPGRGSNQETLQAGSLLMETRDLLSRLFNIEDASQIAFTSNITESLNLGLKGLLQTGDHVITTSMEHNAVARPLYVMNKKGIEWTTVPCFQDGSLDPEEIRKAIQPNTKLICALHASNLTGTIMPIREIGRIAHDHDIPFMLDSAQTAGVLPIDVQQDRIDILCFTGHKGLLGPQGTGGIYINPDLEISTVKEGGTGSFSEYLEHPGFMPDHLEAGTLNTPGIVGLSAGVKFILDQGNDAILKHERMVTQRLLNGLTTIKGVHIYGPQDANKQTAVAAINLEGMDCGDVSMQLDYEYGIVTRSGLHCTPLAHRTIRTLELGACRLSPGFLTKPEQIDYVIQAVDAIAAGRRF
ncbi:MAG: aminotransferase class V-fold PLP-dependent enzyme [Bacillota bacterium]|nr:aminotransferase class V-fold PLP-dependent enzyme [Bacillota bacterium]